MILIFSFYATNFRFHFHPLHYLHFAPIMNAFSFYFPPFLAFLNAERNKILSVRISQDSYHKLIQVIGYNGTQFAQKARNIGVVVFAVKNSAGCQ